MPFHILLSTATIHLPESGLFYTGVMLILVVKWMVSALVIVVVSEVAKRSGYLGGLIASLPLVSILSFIWLYAETRNVKAVSELSYSILWFILPSLGLFVLLPLLLKKGMPFYGALTTACVFTMVAYAGFFFWLQRLGVKF